MIITRTQLSEERLASRPRPAIVAEILNSWQGKDSVIDENRDGCSPP